MLLNVTTQISLVSLKGQNKEMYVGVIMYLWTFFFTFSSTLTLSIFSIYLLGFPLSVVLISRHNATLLGTQN